MSDNPTPEITFWTNHGCGWCHRVHIVLKELNLPYNQILINLDEPRPAWFFELNPRGLVPVLRYKDDNIDKTLTESALIVQFILELHPSHLSPELGNASETAYFRYRMGFFVDAYFGKVNPLMFKLLGAEVGEAQEKKVDELVAMVEREIEPLLKDADPYFGGKKEMTVVEAMTIPFVMRLVRFADDVIWPRSLVLKLNALPAFATWTKHALKQESVTYTWRKDSRERVRERLPAAKAKYAN